MSKPKPAKVDLSLTTSPNQNQKRGNRNHCIFTPIALRFTGCTEEVKNNVFEVHNKRNPELFNKTLKSLFDYILKEYKNGIACSQSISDMMLVVIQEPDRPEDFTDPFQLTIFIEEVKGYVKEKKEFKEQLNSAYGLLLGQSSTRMKCAIKSHYDFETFKKEGNPINLLEDIQEISHRC
jgi:DNA polymerase elongation subunit (family B)